MSFHVQKITGPGATGVQSYTGFGFQPSGVIVATVGRTVGGSGGDAILGVGAFDGTHHWGIGARADDLANTTVTSRTARSDYTLTLLSNAADTNSDVLTVDSLDADGITVNWGTANVVDVHVIAFDGADIEFDVGYFDTPASTGSFAAVSSMAFQPELVMLFTSCLSTTEGPFSEANLNFGAFNATQQIASAAIDRDALGATDTICKTYNTESACMEMLSSTNPPVINMTLTAVSLDSGGFTLDQTVSPGASRRVGYIAFRNVKSYLKMLQASGSTGSQSFTGFGFEPEAVIVWGASTSALDALHADVRAGVGFAGPAAEQRSCMYSSEDAISAGRCAWASSDTRIWLDRGDSSGTETLNCALTSLDADGITINKSTTTGSRYKPFIALRQFTTPPPAGGAGNTVFAIAA